MNRNTFILYFTGFLDLFAIGLLVPLLINHYKNLGASPFLAGILGATYGFVQFFAGPFMGTCSDNYGRKYMLQICFASCAMSYYILSVSSNLFIVFLSRIPIGCFKHTQDLSKSFLAASVKGEKERNKLLSRFSAISNVGLILGPVIGGYLVDSFIGFYYTAAITSFILLINFVIITIFLEENVRVKPDKNDSLSSFANSSYALISKIWIILFVRFLMSFAAFMKRHDPITTHVPSTAGLILSFSGIATGITNFLVHPIMTFYDRNDRRLLIHVSILQGISIILLSLFPDVISQLVFSFPYSLANNVTRETATKVTLDLAKQKNIGLVIGLGSSTIAIARFLAPLVGGISEEFGLYGPDIVAASSSFICAIFILTVVSYRHKKLN